MDSHVTNTEIQARMREIGFPGPLTQNLVHAEALLRQFKSGGLLVVRNREGAQGAQVYDAGTEFIQRLAAECGLSL